MLHKAQSEPGGTVPATVKPVQRIVHRDPMAPPSIGPNDAIVKGQLYFTVGMQASALIRNVSALARAHPTRLQIQFLPIPLSGNVKVARALWAAHAQSKFIEYIEALNTRSPLTVEVLVATAQQIGLRVEPFAQALQSARFDQQLDDARLASRGQSVLWLAGKVVDNVSSIAALESAYSNAYQRVSTVIERGATPDQFEEALAASYADVTPPGQATSAKSPGRTTNVRSNDLFVPNIPLRYLPTISMANASTPSKKPIKADIAVVVMCNPRQRECAELVTALVQLRSMMPSAPHINLNLRWAPLFSPTNAADGLFATAALCANVDLGKTLRQWFDSASNARRLTQFEDDDPVQAVDRLVDQTGMSSAEMSHCRAVMAGTASQIAAQLIAQGLRPLPTLLIAGRIYVSPSLDDIRLLISQQSQTGWLDRLSPAWKTTAESSSKP
jgi:hypothetical protein